MRKQQQFEYMHAHHKQHVLFETQTLKSNKVKSPELGSM